MEAVADVYCKRSFPYEGTYDLLESFICHFSIIDGEIEILADLGGRGEEF